MHGHLIDQLKALHTMYINKNMYKSKASTYILNLQTENVIGQKPSIILTGVSSFFTTTYPHFK